MRIVFLLTLITYINCDQLANLINFVQGGANPSSGRSLGEGRGNPSATGNPRSQPVSGFSQNRAASVPSSGIAFSEIADPSRGTVQLDIPQPTRTAHQAATVEQGRQQLAVASSGPRFAGLPAGATQVGGSKLQIPARPKPQPAPLSQVEAPIFLSETFRSPLNDVNPLRAPVQEPAEALQHRFGPGVRPQPHYVPSQDLPVIMVLKENRRVEQSLNNNGLNYESFIGNVFSPTQDSRGSYNNQPDQGRVQADLTHGEALERHRQALEAAKNLQRQHGQQLHQQQGQQLHQQQGQQLHQQQGQQLHQHPRQTLNGFQPQQQGQNPFATQPQPQRQNLGSRSSHFTIPGGDRQRQFEEELRLAQEALKNLG